MDADKIYRIEIASHTGDGSLKTIGRFWWSEASGLTTDNDVLGQTLARDGVRIGGGWTDIARPGDGKDRELFEALPQHFSGLVRASFPVEVDVQEGNSLILGI
jgi:hypothetical protein